MSNKKIQKAINSTIDMLEMDGIKRILTENRLLKLSETNDVNFLNAELMDLDSALGYLITIGHYQEINSIKSNKGKLALLKLLKKL